MSPKVSTAFLEPVGADKAAGLESKLVSVQTGDDGEMYFQRQEGNTVDGHYGDSEYRGSRGWKRVKQGQSGAFLSV